MVGEMLGGAGQFRLDEEALMPASVAMVGTQTHAGCLLLRGPGSGEYAREASACKAVLVTGGYLSARAHLSGLKYHRQTGTPDAV
jgi:hypothetical protein